MLNTLRKLKSTLFRRYYQWRINSTSNLSSISFRKEPYKFVFLMSHMRSGSSLLTHILCSNPEIIGYGETQIKYSSEADIQALIHKAYNHNAQELTRLNAAQAFKMQHTYVLDKVLHQNLKDLSILKKLQTKSIVLIREPERTLKSILDIRDHWTEETALDYYRIQLDHLIDCTNFLSAPNRFLLLTYHQVISDTPIVLQALQSFFETKHPFSEQYQVKKTTGQAGIGDAVGHIKAGTVVRERRQLDVTISPVIIQKAQDIFEQAQQQLSHTCLTLEHFIRNPATESRFGDE
jgi:hypothetical protein